MYTILNDDSNDERRNWKCLDKMNTQKHTYMKCPYKAISIRPLNHKYMPHILQLLTTIPQHIIAFNSQLSDYNQALYPISTEQ